MDKLSAFPQASPAGERLDSWKEIASYLKRSVRSVQRWEAEEGMPVHRHLHDKRGTVYGFKSELDGWWQERGSILADRNGDEPAVPVSTEPDAPDEVVQAPRSRKAALIGSGFALAVLMVGLVAWLSRNGSATSAGSIRPPPFEAREWILIAAFENRTGEKLFEGTLDYALGLELSNSRHVNVVSRARIADVLRLMRKPLDARLDPQLAREVCLRDGKIRALLSGRAEKLGSKYRFSVQLVDPRGDASLAGFSEESAGPDAALTAMRRISDRVREALGERSASAEGGQLAKVTTSSLRALQLYSQADELMGMDSQAGAEELLRQAVVEDPKFASAYIHLAHAMNNQDKPIAEFLPYAQRAFRLSEATSERERYFIRGSYYFFLGDLEKTIAAWEALVALHPEHGWAVGALGAVYEYPQDLEKAVRNEARLADSHPMNFGFNWNAAYNYVTWMRSPTRAQPYLRRAADLVTPEVTDENRWAVSWIELLPFTQRWIEGDVEGASRELDRVASKLDSFGRRARDTFAVKATLGYLTLGRIEAAERASQKILDPVVRNDSRAQVEFFRGNALRLKEHLIFRADRQLASLSPGWWETLAILQVRAGLLTEALRFVKAEEDQYAKSERRQGRLRASQKTQGRAELHTVPGEIALAAGDLGRAIHQLRQAADLAPEWGRDKPAFFLGSVSLAAALEKTGDSNGAIAALERASARKFQAVINNNCGAYWLGSRFELAKLYRRVGRVRDAENVEAELGKLLTAADRDHPIVTGLKTREATLRKPGPPRG